MSEIFTADLARLTKASCRVPWCCINPGFYFGPDALRSYDADYVGPSAGFWHQFDHAITDADLVLHGTSELFDPPPSSLPRHHHYVGALWWEPNPEASAYLATAGPPWVLVTVSSAPQAEEMTLAQSALQALAEQPVRTLLTLSATHRTDEIGPLPANARIGRFVSHAAVLAHSCLLLSHAGHGVVSKALYYGVPMVLVPWGRDQPGVAARASALGVAEVVTRRDFTTTNLIAAIRKVLGCSRYRENAMRVAARLQAHDAIATARARIEQLLNTPLIYGAQPRRSQADG